MSRSCSICGRSASHEIRFKGNTTYLCCDCYCKQGNAPASWHIGCQKYMSPEDLLLEERKRKGIKQ